MLPIWATVWGHQWAHKDVTVHFGFSDLPICLPFADQSEYQHSSSASSQCLQSIQAYLIHGNFEDFSGLTKWLELLNYSRNFTNISEHNYGTYVGIWAPYNYVFFCFCFGCHCLNHSCYNVLTVFNLITWLHSC